MSICYHWASVVRPSVRPSVRRPSVRRPSVRPSSVRPSSVRPSVRRPSVRPSVRPLLTFCILIFSYETTGPIGAKLGKIDGAWVVPFQNCIR